VHLPAFLDTAEELLAVPSSAAEPEQLQRAIDLVIDFVGPGFALERFQSDGVPSALLYRPAGGRPPFRLILNAHLDVVPAEPEQFRPRREGGRLYARGAQDMKVSGLVQALVFREQAQTLGYPLALQLVADEEVGGRNGTLHQLEQGVTGEFVVVGEYSGLDIGSDAKGLLHIKLQATGLSAHGAYPWLGDNAMAALVRTVSRLLDKYPSPVEEAWHTTVNVAHIGTPNRTFNRIPDRAEAWLDIRFPSDDRELTGEPLTYLRSFCEPGVTVELDQYDPPQHTDPDRPEVTALRRAAEGQGHRPALLHRHGTGDGGFYTSRGIPAVEFGIGGSGQHGPHEFAVIATIEPYYRALTDFVRRLGAL
jgi:succinyl-diaminopimelate desuccinylase